MVGRMVGGIKDLEVESDSEEYEEDEEEEAPKQTAQPKKTGGVFSMFR